MDFALHKKVLLQMLALYLRNKRKFNLVNHSVPTIQFKMIEIVSSFSQAHYWLLDYPVCIMNLSNQRYGIQATA